MLRFRTAALTGLALTTALAAAHAAHAQTVLTFDNRTAFDAVTSGLTTFTFDGETTPQDKFTHYPDGLTVQGVTFNGSDMLYVVDPSFGNGNPFNGHEYLDVDSGTTVNVALPMGTTAFGADFANQASRTGGIVTALINGQSYSFSDPANTSNTSSFFGFTSSAPITSLSFTGGENGPDLDNVSYGTAGPAASAAPEPAAWFSLGLIGLGLAFAVVRARRRSGMAAV